MATVLPAALTGKTLPPKIAPVPIIKMPAATAASTLLICFLILLIILFLFRSAHCLFEILLIGKDLIGVRILLLCLSAFQDHYKYYKVNYNGKY